MWLINTSTLELQSFVGPETAPPYAILSHTWEDGEVNFQEFKDLEQAKTKPGFAKIAKTCELALATQPDPIQYAWVDTCCIDKSSSAELSESINSMFDWYRQSTVCYVFLADWTPDLDWQDFVQVSRPYHQPRRLRWFTRGWTLQELIAPKNMEFYDKDWMLRGAKSDPRIRQYLQSATTIDGMVLEDGSTRNLRKVCLAQRMSWAAHRHTTRKEDIAYCLLGIFQINMPLLYGEGEKAFLRLQEEIIRHSTDFSLFAWQQSHGDSRKYRGILSCHPREFRHLGDCVRLTHMLSQIEEEEAVISSKGLRVETSSLVECLDSPANTSLYNPPPIRAPSFALNLGCMSGGRVQFIHLERRNGAAFVRTDPSSTSLTEPFRRLKFYTLYMAMDHDQDYGDPNDSVLARCRFSSFTNFKKLVNKSETHYLYSITKHWPNNLLGQDEHGPFVRNHQTIFGAIKLCIRRKKRGDASLNANPNVSQFSIVLYRSSSMDSVDFFLLAGDKAENFESFVESLWGYDPITAERKFFAYCFKANLIDRHEALRDRVSSLPKSMLVEDVDEGEKMTATIRIVPPDVDGGSGATSQNAQLLVDLERFVTDAPPPPFLTAREIIPRPRSRLGPDRQSHDQRATNSSRKWPSG